MVNSAYKIDKWDYVLKYVTMASLLTNYVTKFMRDCVEFNVNPCHVLTLASLFFLTNNKRWAQELYLTLVPMSIGAWLALVAPDLNDYVLPVESHNFFVQHWLVVFAYFVPILRGRFHLAPSISVSYTVMAAGLMALYHCWVLAPLGWLWSHNLNYSVLPPKQMLPLGVYYRWFSISIVCMLMFGIPPMYRLMSKLCWRLTGGPPMIHKSQPVPVYHAVKQKLSH